MRTPEKYAAAYKELQWMINFHNKPFWLVATNTEYKISAVKPKPHEIAFGTAAHLYTTGTNGKLATIDAVLWS